MKVSVVIPTLNEEQALRDHLPRLQQVSGIAEIVIADGGSGDQTIDVAMNQGVRVVRAEPGRGSQMNVGARAASGELLVFLHADCWLEPNAVVEARSLVRQKDIIAGVFRQRIQGRRFAYRCIERAASIRARWFRTPYGDSGLFLRRRFFDAIGGFPEIPVCEDLGIARRLRPRGRVALAQSRVFLSARRWEERGVLRTTVLNWWIATLFAAGVAPQRLYSTYYGRQLRAHVRRQREMDGHGMDGHGNGVNLAENAVGADVALSPDRSSSQNDIERLLP